MSSSKENIVRNLVNLGFSDEYICKNYSLTNQINIDELFSIKQNIFKTSYSADNICLLKNDQNNERKREIQEYEDLYEDVSFNVNLNYNYQEDVIDSNKEINMNIKSNSNSELILKEDLVDLDSKYITNNFDENQIKSIRKLQLLTNRISSEVKKENLNDGNIDEKEKYVLKKYKSNLKKKKWDLYVRNSNLINFNNEYKFYHQCNFPSCKRTFSTSGWLKKHLDEHLENEVYKDPLNEQFRQLNINIY